MTSLPLVFDAPKRALPPRHLADLDPADRRAAVGELGLPGFRADQLARHYFGRLTADVDAMTDLPAAAREGLAGAAPAAGHPRDGADLRRRHHPQDAVARARRHARRVGADGLSGPGHGRASPARPAAGWPARSARPARAGCSATCPPPRSWTRCARPPPRPATGRSGSRRGCPTSCSWAWASRWPTTSAWSRRCGGSPTPRPDGLGISARGVTVSTVGLVPAIDKLAAEGLPVTLAVSLHAPDDELRDTLVPVNNRWKVGEVARRRPPLRDHDGPPRLDRVRPDPRRQRPAVAGGPARHAAAAADRDASGCTSTSSRSTPRRAAVGRLAARGAGRVRRAACRPPESRAPSATPVGGRSPPPAASSPPTRAARHRDTAVRPLIERASSAPRGRGADCAACSSP